MSQKKFTKLLDYAIDNNISDLHLSENNSVYVRNSIGELDQLNIQINTQELDEIISLIVSQDKIDNMNDNIYEIDSAYSYNDLRLRVNIYRDKNGMNIALRKIPKIPPSLEQIGITKNLNSFFLAEKGLILVTGSTGSGKSTTLASIIDFINKNRKVNILTLEDPIEYVYEPSKSRISQREVGRDTLSWKSGIKSILRQDPDVIMVGEMRDYDTISAVLTLVETGHIVLATMHTIDAISSVNRIMDIFPTNQQAQVAVQLSVGLSIVISQTLIPLKDGKGKVAAREILINNKAVANYVRDSQLVQIYGVMETQYAKGMRTMDHSLAELVALDKISFETAYARIKSPSNFKGLVKFYKDKHYDKQRILENDTKSINNINNRDQQDDNNSKK